jgi:hypothetical protein
MTPEQRAAAAPHDPESSDVNIFRVELNDRNSMQIGYNFFPEGTVVSWRVSTNGATEASGDFTTLGGGSTQHFWSIPLGVTLDPAVGGVDIAFTWTIGDVPFHYAVRRPV